MSRALAAGCLFLMLASALSAQNRITAQEYIVKYKDLAIEDQEIYGIPASITMAQGLLESDCGNSRLATEANNHFGIKCKREWTGQTISHDDDAPGECFRKYATVEDSYRDHSEFLDKSPRYQALFQLDITDYRGWACGLRDAGYATNPRYAELLIKVIEENELYLLDMEEDLALEYETPVKPESLPEPVPSILSAGVEKVDVDNYIVSVHSVAGHQIYYNNGSEFVIAADDDTYGRIAAMTGISEKRIRKFNDAGAAAQPRSGEQVYIRAKANKAMDGRLMHLVKEGDTMHSIAQMYGIKLKKLAAMNRRSAYDALSPGEQIRLL